MDERKPIQLNIEVAAILSRRFDAIGQAQQAYLESVALVGKTLGLDHEQWNYDAESASFVPIRTTSDRDPAGRPASTPEA